MSVGLGLAYLTETSWPINTGGLPILAWWPNMIIMFEMTMLGAITATVITLIATALMPERGRGFLYDPEVSDGKILVGVENPQTDAVPTLEQAPDGRIKTIQ